LGGSILGQGVVGRVCDLWKVLAESCISHWKLEGSWQQEAKSPTVKKKLFFEIQKKR